MSAAKVGAVMVVGGGVAGIQAALDLAEIGYYVYLVERTPAIGGVMSQLDKTFPTNDCSMCILSPKLVECARHRNIELITNAKVAGLSGEAGCYTVTLDLEPRYVDAVKCVGCGVCAEKCPVKVPNSFNEGLDKRKAIYTKYAQAVPSTYAIDREHCTFLVKGPGKDGRDRCKLCERFCPAKAVDFGQSLEQREIEVGSLILAPGFERYNPVELTFYGYGNFPNVLTSLEFERILSASGPYRGHLVRPGDGKTPERIAWIQCVGSRDTANSGNGYCSSVCCTYALKEAIVAKEHSHKPLETSIFYMDMRTFGKDFERYLERAQDEYGVRLVRSRIYAVAETGDGSRNLILRYATEDGAIQEEEYDLLVLSVGLRPAAGARELASVLGVDLNQYGFCRTSGLEPVNTSREGIYVCGAFCGPQDIPQTVTQASAAAAASASFLSPVRGTLVKEQRYPSQRDVAGEPPRLGVFICHCGINIGGVVNVPAVKEFAASLPGVVLAEECLYACSQDNQEKIKEKIAQYGLNRLVVASCTPRTHEALFRQTMCEASLNPYLFEMANIREHCAWVHMKEGGAATAKAKMLVGRAVARARLLEPLSEIQLDLNREAMVVGGGIAGMVAALELARQGYGVRLVEKNNSLGGLARRIKHNLEGQDVSAYLSEMEEEVLTHPLIEVHLNSQVQEVAGYVGNFTTRLVSGEETREIKHGVVVIAIGGGEYRPGEYLYGEDQRVMTALELEQAMTESGDVLAGAKTVVMIQCVGSRENDRPYCSRVCCSEAVKNALRLKELKPDLHIYVLYRDIRTYGFKEDYYQQARTEGVLFIRYDRANKPAVELVGRDTDNTLRVSFYDPILERKLAVDADLVVLAAAITPPEDSSQLARCLKVPRNEDGFFLEAHMKLRPVDFTTDGIFLCGLAHGPKFIDETIAQAKAAAARAATVLARETMVAGGVTSVIDQERCAGCRVCMGLCPYQAISFDEELGTARINEVLCKGCGVCSAACPSRACSTRHFKDEYIFAEIEALLGRGT